ncbi:hypothetical protein F5Y15DRAFT_83743 [Xylariaceae sp. FL0016]|nr:hypothetical protein F5Y15DRAFT_83743 [Xylariaceae sp. FL0016]
MTASRKNLKWCDCVDSHASPRPSRRPFHARKLPHHAIIRRSTSSATASCTCQYTVLCPQQRTARRNLHACRGYTRTAPTTAVADGMLGQTDPVDAHQPIGFVCCQCRYRSSGSNCSNPDRPDCPHRGLPRCGRCPILFTPVRSGRMRQA